MAIKKNAPTVFTVYAVARILRIGRISAPTKRLSAVTFRRFGLVDNLDSAHGFGADANPPKTFELNK
jgi:hypothetical protein